MPKDIYCHAGTEGQITQTHTWDVGGETREPGRERNTYLSLFPLMCAHVSRLLGRRQGQVAWQQAHSAEQGEPHSCRQQAIVRRATLMFPDRGWRNLYGFAALDVEMGESFARFLSF